MILSAFSLTDTFPLLVNALISHGFDIYSFISKIYQCFFSETYGLYNSYAVSAYLLISSNFYFLTYFSYSHSSLIASSYILILSTNLLEISGGLYFAINHYYLSQSRRFLSV